MEIVFATGNPNKVMEVNTLLQDCNDLRIVSLKEKDIDGNIPETGSTLEENAKQKAYFIHSNYHIDCFSEDTGLEVDVLDGAPGVYSARYAGPQKKDADNVELLLENLKDKTNRKARFKTVICLLIGQEEFIFEGIVEGEILKERQGKGGFGYDPVFKPAGYDRSFAEMTKEEKNRISHRGKAVKKLVDFLSARIKEKR